MHLSSDAVGVGRVEATVEGDHPHAIGDAFREELAHTTRSSTNARLIFDDQQICLAERGAIQLAPARLFTEEAKP